jgi:hypothetical protein
VTPPIDHDAIFKELLSTFFLDFLELFAPQVLEYAEPTEFSLEPTETVREVFSPITQGKKKVADVVARLKFQDQAACFLVHVESQSSAYSQEDFRLRMFQYFARLHEKFSLPVYPIALFTFDEPFQEQDTCYVVRFPDRQVLEFSFVSIQQDILRILEIRFEEISQDLRKTIGQIEDLQVLENLLVQAVTTQSLEAFTAAAQGAWLLEEAEPISDEADETKS